MRKRVLSLLLCLLLCLGLFPLPSFATGDRYLEINAANFPDAKFRQIIIECLPISGNKKDGWYMTKNAVNEVREISVEESGIKSLVGVEHFTALEELYCDVNQLTELDVSKNTALVWLYCDNNRLTSLNLGSNLALEQLFCNNNRLTELDVSKNAKLQELSCFNNKLTELDVSKNTELVYLCCCTNQLTALDVSRNTGLEHLNCSENLLTELDVSRNTALNNLECSENLLTELDVRQNPLLYALSCDGNRLASIDLSRHTELRPGRCQFGGQQVLPQNLALTAGGYTCDLGALVIDPARVTVTTASGTYDAASGIVLFPKALSSFTYVYATGQGSMSVTVPVIPPPTITTHPKSVTVKSGAKASFTVKVKGKNVGYRWFVRTAAEDPWTELPGEGKNTLSVVTTGAMTGWQYRCQVQNQTGGVTYSDIATLTVTPQPASIKTQPKDAKVKSGAKAKFKVSGSGPNLSYQWFGRADADAEWAEIDGANKAELSFTASMAKNGSQYYCKVWNDDGSADSNVATLTVTPQPAAIKTQPKDVTVKSESKGKFTVKASGPNLHYQWFTRASEADGWTEIDGATKAEYSFTAKLSQNGAQFYCRVWNDDETLDSAPATLTVTPQPPTIKTQPKDAKVKAGAKATFKAKASGKNVAYQWYYRTSPDGEWILLEGETNANLTVTATEENFGFQYRCRAQNADGEVFSAPATLTLK